VGGRLEPESGAETCAHFDSRFGGKEATGSQTYILGISLVNNNAKWSSLAQGYVLSASMCNVL